MQLWVKTPGMCEEIPIITPYIPQNKKSNAAIIIFAGGAYHRRADHEGAGYAEFLSKNGITAFVVDYRVAPHKFPIELLDARRSVRWVRAHAEEYGIDKNKIAVMGSSAGGHLSALVSTYRKPIDHEGIDDIDKECCYPNLQILCYPVTVSPHKEGISHRNSYFNLIGSENIEIELDVDPTQNVTSETPPAFIWHTAEDAGVSVINSYQYATELRKNGVDVEMHIFPHGKHGLGLAPNNPHVAQWSALLIEYLKYINWLE